MTMKRLLITGSIVATTMVFAACQPTQQATVQEESSAMQQETTQDSTMEGEAIEKTESAMQQMTTGQYVTYSADVYEQSKAQTRVLFFHATWCPTCKQANEEFTSQVSRIPENVVVLKTDYDNEKELKQKYGITYQHTFVQVDVDGNTVKKWNGGGVDKLVSEVQ